MAFHQSTRQNHAASSSTAKPSPIIIGPSANNSNYNSSRSPSPRSVRNGGDDGAETKVTRKKRRGLLAQYYGDASPSPDVRKAKERIDPLDVDGPDFDPDMYLKKILYESTVSQLADTENMFVNEIRSLDSDVQTLVYENYNKFISATDTIRQMKGKFELMETEMINVQENMDSIMDLRETIHSTLDTNRRSLSQLSGVHLLLKKLQFLFELPSRLKRCVEIKAYRQAVRYYSKSHAILGRYEHLPSFQGIRSECNLSITNLIALLQERLLDPTLISYAELSESFELLVVLEEGTIDELSTSFLKRTDEWLAVYVKTMETKLENLSSEDAAKPEEFLDFCNTRYLHAVKEFIREYVKIFLRPVDTNIYSGNAKSTNMERQSSVGAVTTLTADGEVANVVSQKDLRLKLFNGVQKHMSTYMELVRRMLTSETQMTDAVYVVCVYRLHVHSSEVDAIYPEAGVHRISEKYTRIVLENRMHNFRSEFMRALDKHLMRLSKRVSSEHMAGEDEDEDGAAFALGQGDADIKKVMQDATTTLLKECVMRLVERTSAFISDSVNLGSRKSWRNTFVQKYVYIGVLVALIHHIPLYFMKLCGTELPETVIPQPATSKMEQVDDGIDDVPTCETLFGESEILAQWQSEPRSPETALMLSKLCKNMSTTHIQNMIADFLAAMGSVKIKENTEECAALVAGAHAAAEALLKRHVHLQGVVLSEMVLKSVSTRDWLRGSEPRMVRAAIKRCVDEFAEMELIVSHYYEYEIEDAKTDMRLQDVAARRQSVQRSGRLGAGVDINLMANIQRLFAERIVIFGEVDFSTPSIMTGILKIVLKAFQEGVRVQTFGQFGYNQLEVDLLYLKGNLWRSYIDDDMAEHMYSEILVSAERRCLNPVPMNRQVAATIVDG
ncbi:hypothetical protein SARC_05561 [Sphaeroforma arctica JP610]|uniref:Vacuolar protein sorting-associated protein 51 homolog n=1 Tax=Sphaeroforma arctica JP610 TaxID=667725 RepID=A0A0L0FZZ7_9EUKA|nr:hypothetical protein SARC_05561 [Sphaeroforma arctica JP610]KNC82141.1 hypothetical protein SARC_05561 [Sphaeroforma arctica JP610]|eukprot:XP_014156043.1 hypothetical protein SARC_05561 [Sphaeroforma arctica JP610]